MKVDVVRLDLSSGSTHSPTPNIKKRPGQPTNIKRHPKPDDQDKSDDQEKSDEKSEVRLSDGLTF